MIANHRSAVSKNVKYLTKVSGPCLRESVPLLIKHLAKVLLGQSVNQHRGELLTMTHGFAAKGSKK